MSYCTAQLQLNGWGQSLANILTPLASLEKRQILSRDYEFMWAGDKKW